MTDSAEVLNFQMVMLQPKTHVCKVAAIRSNDHAHGARVESIEPIPAYTLLHLSIHIY